MTPPVELSWEVEARPVADEVLCAAVEAALEHGGQAERLVSLALVSDAALAELHGRFLDDPSPTDVMSFPLEVEGGGPAQGPWGEVVASVDRAVAVAAERGVTTGEELLLYVVHGTLHLCGWRDGSDAERTEMRAAEAAVLGRLGVR